MPLAESGIIGTAVGLALRGYRPVCEIQFDGFVYPAFDQIVTQVAKMRARRWARSPCRWSSGSPSAAASARSSTTRSPRRRTSRTPPACAWCPAPTGGRLLDDPAGHPLRRPGRVLRAEAPLLDKAQLDETETPGPLYASRVVRPGADATLVAYGRW